MLLATQEIRYINSITHAGKVVLFGTDSNGKIWYTIKQDGFEDSYLNTPAQERIGWEDWQELELPNEAEDDASVVENETKEFTYQDNPSQFILRSRYRTQDQTAVAPVQLVSGMQHLYVFRQSKQNTLLCDRYVLDGITNKLVRKLQIRFKRSRQRFEASDNMQQTAGGLKNVDSLDYRDANGIPFYEPTTELTFIKNLHQGWFSVIQLPTVEHAKFRWNIFAYNSQTQKVDLYSLRVSEDGLFAVHDYNIFEPKSEDDPTLIPYNIPGIIKRTLDLNVQVGNGISATKYYVQVARETDAGQQLMRDATKVMLGIVTTNNTVAAISFTALGDGTLSKIQETSNPQILRNNIREVLLPLNSLDNIKGIGIAEPTPEGTITALKRTITDGIPNVQITSAEASVLKNGDELAIVGTTAYDGHYTITKIDETTFEIDAPWVENGNPSTEKLGTWQVVPPEQQAVIFDGLITGYQITPQGKLRVTAENHGLENGDQVQIFDTVSYDGAYPITKVDDQNFIINNLRWQIGEAVSLKLQSQKRRGIVFDGAGDYIDCGTKINLAQKSFTIEFWAKRASFGSSQFVIGQGKAIPNQAISIGFRSSDNFFMAFWENAIETPTVYQDKNWHHYACTYDSKTKTQAIYCDGKLVISSISSSDTFAQGNFYIGCGFDVKNEFNGCIADVRIWKVARTAKEIKNSMYLRLTGKETDLIGYWRLGGIAIDEDNQRTVIDFSVNRNDGIVYGNTYVGEITLNRYLKDGITPIVKFTNSDLVAVSQRATYIEEFEFKVNPIVDVNNADGNGNKIFQLAYWGQTSRQAKDQISIVSQQNEFVDLGNGWYRATSRFTISDDINLLRTFEIADICGSWDTLEIRKHHLRLISNIITEASFNDRVKLSALGLQDPQDSQAIKQLASQETRQGYLIQEKLQLEAQLNALLSQGLDRDKRIQELQTAISNQQTLVNRLQNDVNYWNGEKQRGNLEVTLYEDTYYNDYREWSNKWTRKLGIGYYYDLKLIMAESTDDTIDIYQDIDSLKVPEGLKITLYAFPDCLAPFVWSQKTLTSNNYDLGDWRNTASSLKIETINGNTNKEHIQKQLDIKQSDLSIARKDLTALEEDLSLLTDKDLSTIIAAIQARLQIINSEIQSIWDSFASLNQAVLDAITNLTQTALTLPQLSQYPQGLVTQGGILNFVNPVSRIHALETCEGNVQLSYFDKQGNMRNTLYDATSDSLNTTFEEWIPDGLRSCLNFNTESSLVSLNSPVYVKDNFTLEAWFAYPFTEQLHWRVLASSDDDQQQIVVHESKQLGLRLNGSFFDCGYDLTQLSVGWHHLTITSKYQAQTTSFYIDGEEVGITEAKITSNISTLGNITNVDSIAPAPTPKNSALQFDGVNDYIATKTSLLNNRSVFTLEGWVKAISLGDSSVSLFGQNDVIEFGVNGQKKLIVWTPQGGTLIADTLYPINEWHHVAVVGNGKNIIFYLDGTLIKTGGVATSNYGSSSYPFQIAAGVWDGGNKQPFSGQIAEVRVWNKARTQAEIQADMNKTLTGNESGLVGYWPLRDGFAEDYSASKNNGTIYGSPQTVSFEPVQLVTTFNPNACHFGKLAEVRFWDVGLNDQEIAIHSKIIPSGNEPGLIAYYPMNEATGDEVRDYSGNSRHGKIQRASWWGCTASIGNLGHTVMKFDGKNDYVDCGNGINLAKSSFTIEFWAKRNALGAWNVVIGQGQKVSNQALHIGFKPDNKFTFAFYGNDLDTAIAIADFQWHHWVCSYNAKTNERIIYLDGNVTTKNIASADYQGTGNLFIGGFMADDLRAFSGQLAEVRIWKKVLTSEEIKTTMHQNLTGQETGLLGYLPLNKIQPEGATVQTPDLTDNHPGTVHEALIVKDNTLPIGADAVVSSEYGTFEINSITKQKSAMMRRMFASPTLNGVKLITDKRIETLELLWIGNAQFAPTLLGYIEGAPPVPSENMNIDGDYQYNGATSVQLTTTEDVEYSWNRSQDTGLGASFDLFVGAKSQTSSGGGIGGVVITTVEETKVGVLGNLDFSYQWLNESNVSSSSSLAMTDRLELRGAPEVTPKFPHYGNRFIPKNVGYALVVSSLADVFITRLSRSKKMVGYEVRPVEDIPPDVNTITFLINPAYVMNGSLDGLVGSSAANDKFYGHVPEMRSQYGSLYPASYFRLMEAYNLKQQIEKADKERLAYFNNFNSNRVDEASLNRQAGEGIPLQGVNLNEGAETIDSSGGELTDQEKEAQLEDTKKQGEQRKEEIKSRIGDMEKLNHALESFAGWQKTMENILVRSGKRNIVNTYVWDADGGLRMEEQSFANTTEHTIGGSFTLSGGLGLQGGLAIGKVAAKLTGLATMNLTQTMTKTQASSKGMELNVDLSGIEVLGITDENDIPFQPGEKVDRFRMMSFYLEGSTDNYLDFFNYVVDPEWLASNDEEARALRQVQSGRPNKTWRVLHRVTYVERPSLMGFGRDMRSLAEIASFSQARMSWLIPANATVLDEVKAVRNRVEYLENENAKLQAKLDQIIDLLNNQ